MTLQPRCPPPRDGHELEGCGSYNVVGPDMEGLYDCWACGLWLNAKEAFSHPAITDGLKAIRGKGERV